jgi:hypothetical protein
MAFFEKHDLVIHILVSWQLHFVVIFLHNVLSINVYLVLK